MPQSKIDSKCFNLTKKVDSFLSLSNVGRTDLTPPGFWKELASDEEAVSRSVVSKTIPSYHAYGMTPMFKIIMKKMSYCRPELIKFLSSFKYGLGGG